MAIANLNTRRRRPGGRCNVGFAMWHREILASILLAVLFLQLYIQRAWLFGASDDEIGLGLMSEEEVHPVLLPCPSIDIGLLKAGLVCLQKCSPPEYNTLRGMDLDPNEKVKISMPESFKRLKINIPNTKYGKYRIHFPEEGIDLDLTARLSNEIQLAVEDAKPDATGKKVVVENGYMHTRSNTERLLRRIVAKLLRAGVLDPSKDIVNTGSWIGDNALPWALMLETLRPDNPGKVIAIDPSEKFVEDMADLANVNGVGNLCAQVGVLSSTVERVAFIGESNEHITIHTKDSIERGSWKKQARFKQRASWLNAVTLDSLNLGAKVSLLHIDVEGHEGELLQGAKETIYASRPIIITEGYNIWPVPVDTNDAHLLAVLTELGYKSSSEIPEHVGLKDNARNRIWWPDFTTRDAAMAIVGKELEREDVVPWVATELSEFSA